MRTDSSSTEWLILVECASTAPDQPRLDALLERPPDWAKLYSLADDHGVLALLAARLQNCEPGIVPAPFLKRLQDWQRAQLFFTLGMTAELIRLKDKFAQAGIEFALVKGPVLSLRAYGDPGFRQYNDLDILLRHRDILRATEAMLADGFVADVPLEAIAAQKTPGEYVFTRPGRKLLIELHTQQTLRYFPRPLPIELFFSRRKFEVLDMHQAPALAPEDELILVCIHNAKHFWERLMWIADVGAFVTRQKDLDWKCVAETTRLVGAGAMLRTALQLAASVLKTALPQEAASLIANDRKGARFAAKIAARLPGAGHPPLSVSARAAFRSRMRGGFPNGWFYLLRLSLSPTEEDWTEGAEGKTPRFLDALRRPFRLFKKYGREGKSSR